MRRWIGGGLVVLGFAGLAGGSRGLTMGEAVAGLAGVIGGFGLILIGAVVLRGGFE